MASASSSSNVADNIARKTFELANDIVELDERTDAIFKYDDAEQARIRYEAPWKSDPNFFQRVRISSAALIKMMIHTRAGGIFEVMGTMTGKVDVATRTIYIMDAFALPVQGTETRVNAGEEAYEFMVQWQESAKKVGRLENAIGWYHSHPGYGCWLSGIDVDTQMTNQLYQDPFVAVVIDPNRTMSAGRVDIGAFRTYPRDFRPPDAGPSEYQTIPLNKIEDFGVHADRYYPLKVEHFKSSLDGQLLDLLWNKYWASTLAQSPVVVNRAYAVGQLEDLANKMRLSEAGVARRGPSAGGLPFAAASGLGKAANGGGGDGAAAGGADATGDRDASTAGEGGAAGTSGSGARVQRIMAGIKKREGDAPLAKVANDGTKVSLEAHNGLISQVLKDALFNRSATGAPLPPAA